MDADFVVIDAAFTPYSPGTIQRAGCCSRLDLHLMASSGTYLLDLQCCHS